MAAQTHIRALSILIVRCVSVHLALVEVTSLEEIHLVLIELYLGICLTLLVGLRVGIHSWIGGEKQPPFAFGGVRAMELSV